MTSKPIEHMYKGGDDFWVKYQKGRAKIPQSYFDTIFDYHQKHGGEFSVAHDVGAGGGVHSRRLLDRFQHVIVSDPHENNVEAARSQLQGLASRCTFKATTLENSINTEPAQSVDLVFGQSMWHFTDPHQAIAAVAHQLKPGGTIAISMTGIPVFKDLRLWEIWSRLTREVVRDAVNKSGGPHGPARRPMLIQFSQLDSVPVSSEYFEPGAVRLKMTDPLGPGRSHMREAYLPEEFEKDLPHWSEIGETDIVTYVDEKEDWKFKVNYEGIRDIAMTFPHDFESEVQIKMWEEIKELLGDGETEVIWPFQLVLATRRKADEVAV